MDAVIVHRVFLSAGNPKGPPIRKDYAVVLQDDNGMTVEILQDGLQDKEEAEECLRLLTT